VAEEEEGEAGVLLAGVVAHKVEVVDDRVEATVVGEVAGVLGRARRGAVPAVVTGVHGIPGCGEPLREPGVALGVLGHAVRDLDDALGRAVGQPPVDVQLGAVGRGQGEAAGLHGPTIAAR
jgi:hypothetical protein